MSSKHTPGPWSANPGSNSDSHYMVFKADGNFLTLDDEQHEYNARLIAAAPELLEALKTMTDEYAASMRDAGVTHYPEALAIVRQARAVISKAKGETNG